jgi:hypothetical protein
MSEEARVRHVPGEPRPGGFRVELLKMELDQTKANVVGLQLHWKGPLLSVCADPVFRAPGQFVWRTPSMRPTRSGGMRRISPDFSLVFVAEEPRNQTR